MSFWADSFASLGEDWIGGGGPSEGFAVLVVAGDEVIDSGHQVLDQGEHPRRNGLAGDDRDAALDLVQPELQVRMRCKCRRGRAASHL